MTLTHSAEITSVCMFVPEIIHFILLIHDNKCLHWKWLNKLDFGICCHIITPTYLKHKFNVLAAYKLLTWKIVL